MRARIVAFESLPARFGELEIRAFRPGDEHQILATFNRVFARVDPGFRPRELGPWRWRYEQNPSGSRILLAVLPDGRIAGHLGVLLARVRVEGQPSHFCQVVDQFSDAELTAGLKRGSLAGVLNNTMVALHKGRLPHQDWLGWGLPVPVAWRMGKSFARYEIIRTQLKLCAAPGDVRAAAAPRVALEEVQQFPADVGHLFERASAVHRAIAVRDKAQLDWRWRDHPEKRYHVALARRGAELVGYAVWTRGDFDGEKDEALLADWLVAPLDEGAAAALVAWYAAAARAAGLARLTAIFPDVVPEWMAFQEAGFRVRPTRYFFIGRLYVRGYDARWMNRHWYYTLGDTDLV